MSPTPASAVSGAVYERADAFPPLPSGLTRVKVSRSTRSRVYFYDSQAPSPFSTLNFSLSAAVFGSQFSQLTCPLPKAAA